MFNNPFDSFHKTVGKAKQEREQLDRLLTISTPGELALVILTAAILLLFVGWLFLGNVSRSVTVEGVLVEPGAQVQGESPSLEALVWLESDLAQEIESGMPAVLEVFRTDGDAQSLDGNVATLVAVPASEDLARLEHMAPVSVNRVRITLKEGLGFASPDGTECRIVIELGRQAPLAFLAGR